MISGTCTCMSTVVSCVIMFLYQSLYHSVLMFYCVLYLFLILYKLIVHVHVCYLMLYKLSTGNSRKMIFMPCHCARSMKLNLNMNLNFVSSFFSLSLSLYLHCMSRRACTGLGRVSEGGGGGGGGVQGSGYCVVCTNVMLKILRPLYYICVLCGCHVMCYQFFTGSMF